MILKMLEANNNRNCQPDILGVIQNINLDFERSILEKRFQKNLVSKFEPKNIDERVSPAKILPDVKTIFVVGCYYGNRRQKNGESIFSIHSLGEDYHITVRRVLESLALNLKREFPEMKYKICVDTSPLIDRAMAAHAMIGYYGKNCSIINPDFGSFIYIGSLLTNYELSVLMDQSSKFKVQGSKFLHEAQGTRHEALCMRHEARGTIHETLCTNCRLCLDACPTGALEEPYSLNPSKCLSEITQKKGDVDEKYISKITTVYGCDICQNVCPHNKKLRKEIEYYDAPGIEELLTIDTKTFKNRYGNCSFSWVGLKTLQRNARIVAKNLKR